jgi:hypothetical protein
MCSILSSAFSCELFLKAWIAEDKIEHIYSPYHQVTHVRYKQLKALIETVGKYV